MLEIKIYWELVDLLKRKADIRDVEAQELANKIETLFIEALLNGDVEGYMPNSY